MSLAHQVLVLDQGHLVEAGTHEELLDQRAAYYTLWQLQSGFTVRSDGRYAEVNAERLRLIPLFATLDNAVLEELACQFNSEHFRQGEIVIRQGEPGEKFYIIVRGKVAMTRRGSGDKPVELAVLQDGDYFGEIALIEEGLRTATATTLLPTLCLTLDRERFSRMMSQHAAVGQEITDLGMKRSLKTTLSQGRRKRATTQLDKLLDI